MIKSNPRWRKIRAYHWRSGLIRAGLDLHDLRNDPTMYRPGSMTQWMDTREHRRSARMKTGDHKNNKSIP